MAHDAVGNYTVFFKLSFFFTIKFKDRGSGRDYGHYHIPAVRASHKCCPFFCRCSVFVFGLFNSEWRAARVETDIRRCFVGEERSEDKSNYQMMAWRMPATSRSKGVTLGREKSWWKKGKFCQAHTLQMIELMSNAAQQSDTKAEERRQQGIAFVTNLFCRKSTVRDESSPIHHFQAAQCYRRPLNSGLSECDLGRSSYWELRFG